MIHLIGFGLGAVKKNYRKSSIVFQRFRSNHLINNG
jgi:hypothetical protein